MWPCCPGCRAGSGGRIRDWTSFQNRSSLSHLAGGVGSLEGRIPRPFSSPSRHFSCPSRRVVGSWRVSVGCCFTCRVRERERQRRSSAQHLPDLLNQERQVGLGERQVQGGHPVVFDALPWACQRVRWMCVYGAGRWQPAKDHWGVAESHTRPAFHWHARFRNRSVQGQWLFDTAFPLTPRMLVENLGVDLHGPTVRLSVIRWGLFHTPRLPHCPGREMSST
jgi:hypothetical protein